MAFVLFLLDSGYAITCFQKGSFPLGDFFFKSGIVCAGISNFRF